MVDTGVVSVSWFVDTGCAFIYKMHAFAVAFRPAGASTEVKDSEGRTPLIAACAAGHLEAVKALAGKGAAVEAVGKVRGLAACGLWL